MIRVMQLNGKHKLFFQARRAGVGAAGTGSGTVEAVLDAAQEHVAIEAARLWVQLDDLLNRHVISSVGTLRRPCTGENTPGEGIQ